MSLSAALRRAPLRVATGAYILNAGLGKLGGDDDVAKGVHQMAAGAYPAFEKIDPKTFLRVLGVTEVSLGAALLLPVVPAAVAGLGLAGFSAGLLGLYWRTPSMHRPGDPRPTQEGVAIAKDTWMFGIGTGLVIDALTAAAHDTRVSLTSQVKQAAAVNAALGTRKAESMAGAARSRARRARRKVDETAGSLLGEAKATTGHVKGLVGEAKGRLDESAGSLLGEARGKGAELTGRAARRARKLADR